MMLEQSKLSMLMDKQQIERKTLTSENTSLVKKVIAEIGLCGALDALSELCEQECTKGGDQTLNCIAIELQNLAYKIKVFRDILKIEYRNKPEK